MVKETKKAYQEKYYQEHKEERKKYRQKHKDKIKKYRQEHKKEMEKYRQEHKKEMEKYRQEHKEEKKAYGKKYHQAHKEERNKRRRNRRKNNIGLRLNDIMSGGINKSLKTGKEGKTWKKCVDYNIKDLIKRLKSTMPAGYTWKEYAKGQANLHVDHIIPKAAFNITGTECTDFKRCWALKNLQLLPAKENLSKSATIEKPFQTSFIGF